jgi:hypothetical protein
VRRRRVRPAGAARSEGGIILPNGVVPPRAAQLLVPRGYEDPEPPVMVGVCTTCEARFYRGQEEDWERMKREGRLVVRPNERAGFS